jgi:hypothetical protein
MLPVPLAISPAVPADHWELLAQTESYHQLKVMDRVVAEGEYYQVLVAQEG